MELKVGQKFHPWYREELHHIVGFVKDEEERIVVLKYWNNYDKWWEYDAAPYEDVVEYVECDRQWNREEKKRKQNQQVV